MAAALAHASLPHASRMAGFLGKSSRVSQYTDGAYSLKGEKPPHRIRQFHGHVLPISGAKFIAIPARFEKAVIMTFVITTTGSDRAQHR
ncbi:hypothetical protein AB0F17_61720 [Nonomuraea sp. NPDC026600]|uniref:hypothetical protein n=1 Tax=Nonomuraea sp. NPDC026600 TaxID=3155363 RepID=UPI0033D7202F